MFIPGFLAQSAGLSSVFVRVGSLARYSYYIDIACAILSSLSASCGTVHILILPRQIVNLCALDRYLCSAILLLGNYFSHEFCRRSSYSTTSRKSITVRSERCFRAPCMTIPTKILSCRGPSTKILRRSDFGPGEFLQENLGPCMKILKIPCWHFCYALRMLL